jgi:hypothetical protein
MENYQHSLARNSAPPKAGSQLATGTQPMKINYVITGEGAAAPVAASGK